MTRTRLVVSAFAALATVPIGAANAWIGPNGEHARTPRHGYYDYSGNCRNQSIYWTDQFGEHAVPKRDCEER